MKKHLMILPTGEFVEKTLVTATLVKRTVCPCGFPTVADHVPTGKVYDAVLDSQERTFKVKYICGGCKQTVSAPAILVRDKDGPLFKLLPVELLELEKP